LAEIRNPNLSGPGGHSGGSGGDMRGLVSMTFLALIILLGFQYFGKPKQPVKPAPAPQTQSQQQSSPQPAPQAAVAGQPAQLQAAAGQAPAAVPSIAAPTITETTVENGNFKIVFTNRGAQAEHWILTNKQYKDHPDPGGHQLDLINPRAAAFGLPLSLFTYEPELTKQLNEALYEVTVSGATSPAGVLQAPGSVSFHYAANGLDAVKTFRFDKSYVVTAEVQVRRNGVPVRALLAWPGGLGDQMNAIDFSYGKFAGSVDGKTNSIDAKKVSDNATLDQPFEYAAVMDLYFASAFLPDAPARTTVVTLHNSIQQASDPSDPNSPKRAADVIGLAVGDTSGTTRLRLYAGPKQLDQLKVIHATDSDGKPTGPSLEPLIQYGWLTVIAKPLYLCLRFFYEHGIGNWGWAIVVFTILFNLILLPTRIWMTKSSLKMMRIQPKVDVIKKRYAHLKATDPKRSEMNTEMMELYKTEGVNMYGGCLPMLLQMPLFFAYYRVLQNTVELRQAQWYWLTDLSSPDMLHILPILIIISMFFMQYITPAPGMDPNQRRMMAFMMPIVFGFMLWHLASGLALYWGTGNLINLAIQIGINMSPMGREMFVHAARRAAKKSGSGAISPIRKKQ
jgi:YidC/Oxa1 family membrane protein insertase